MFKRCFYQISGSHLRGYILDMCRVRTLHLAAP